MKILREGSIKKLHPQYKFTCSKCGCIFVDEKDNCHIFALRNQEYVYHSCPFCEADCVGSHYDDNGQFLFSADTISEAAKALENEQED